MKVLKLIEYLSKFDMDSDVFVVGNPCECDILFEGSISIRHTDEQGYKWVHNIVGTNGILVRIYKFDNCEDGEELASGTHQISDWEHDQDKYFPHLEAKLLQNEVAEENTKKTKTRSL